MGQEGFVPVSLFLFHIPSNSWQKTRDFPCFAALSLGHVDDSHRVDDGFCSTEFALVHNDTFQLACGEATKFSLEWLWVDSVQLASDRSLSRAKALSQAYRLAEKCFVHLTTLAPSASTEVDLAAWSICSWFRQIYALPALLVSSYLHFYDTRLCDRGDKSSPALRATISKLTGIPEHALCQIGDVEEIPAAKRMNLASGMAWTDSTDLAFVLANLFGVCHFSPLSGGVDQFFLLQQEMANEKLGDMSLLAWESDLPGDLHGVFAESPVDFAHSAASTISKATLFRNLGRCRLAYDQGLEIDADCAGCDGEDLLMEVGTITNGKGKEVRMAVRLRQSGERFCRVAPYRLCEIDADTCTRTRRLVLDMKVDQYISNSAEAQRPLSPKSLHRPPSATGKCNKRPKRPIQELDSLHLSNLPVSYPNNDHLQPSEAVYASEREQTPRSSKRAKRSTAANSSCTDCTEIRLSRGQVDAARRIPDTPFSNLDDVGDGLSHGAIPTPATESAFPEDEEESAWDATVRPRPAPLSRDHAFLQAKDQIFAHLHDDISNMLQARMTSTAPPQSSPAKFACPIYAYNKTKHISCLKQGGFTSIEQVKRHLGAYHRTPHYCPTCWQTFPTLPERDDHLMARTCQDDPTGMVDVVSDDHVQELIQSYLGPTGEESWRTIFSVIFADRDVNVEALSPFLTTSESYPSTTSLEYRVLTVCEYWTKNGRAVVSGELEKRNLLNWGLPREERDLAAFHTMIEDELLENVIYERCGWNMRGLVLEN